MAWIAVLLSLGSGCGSSTSGPSPNTIAVPTENVTQVSVDFGLPNIGFVNGVFATVTVCVPGSSDCQTIDHLLVDTGSSGLRLLGSALTLALPAWTDGSGRALAECGQFISGFIWGPLRIADLSIAGEQARGIAIQVIDASTYPVPRSCTGLDAGTPEAMGANGVLGVGAFLQDCGAPCAAGLGPNSENPGMYYTCSSTVAGGCQPVALPASRQVANPVAHFGQDNNGTILELPAIPADGAPIVTGALVFGIGTRTNNELGRASLLRLDNYGEFLTRYPKNGSEFAGFIDSGSNAVYFPAGGAPGLATCSDPNYKDFYCPRSTSSLSAQVRDTYGSAAVSVNFTVANAAALFSNPYNVAFDNLGCPITAPQSGTSNAGSYFDWGLPFHFGKKVFTAIEGQATPSGMGPFVAF